MNDRRCVLEAANIRKSYPSGTSVLHVLRGIDLKVHEGELVAILGKSGSGKTTLLHILGALDQPDSGEVFINQKQVNFNVEAKVAAIRRDEVGFVFQFFHLLPEMTALENVMMPALIARRKTHKARQKAQELLDYFGLRERARHRPSELSGGEQQRIAIARAVINDPQILLLDEPTGNLDMQNGELVWQLIERLNKELSQSMVLVTHNPELACRCSVAYRLESGMLEKVTADKLT